MNACVYDLLLIVARTKQCHIHIETNCSLYFAHMHNTTRIMFKSCKSNIEPQFMHSIKNNLWKLEWGMWNIASFYFTFYYASGSVSGALLSGKNCVISVTKRKYKLNSVCVCLYCTRKCMQIFHVCSRFHQCSREREREGSWNYDIWLWFVSWNFRNWYNINLNNNKQINKQYYSLDKQII